MNWFQLAEQHREQFLKELIQFLSINSVEEMTTATEVQPFGAGVAQALDFLLHQATQDGFHTRNYEGYAGTIDYGQADEQVGILAHVDVVPAGDPAEWTTPPFQPDIRNGRIYARGAIDDKGPALAAYYALKIVRDTGLPLTKQIRYIIGTDEESGWLCMKRYGELATFPEIGFSPDADFPIIHAEKGQINPTITLPPEQDQDAPLLLRSFTAGERVNMVPDSAVAVIETKLDLSAQFTSFLKKYDLRGIDISTGTTFTLIVNGQSAHGMNPQTGRNAGTWLASFLHELPFTGTAIKFLHFLANTLHEDHHGDRLGVACADEVTGNLTVNPGVLSYDQDSGGVIKLNIRYPATISPEERVQRLREKLQMLDLHLADVRTSKSHYVPQDHPAIQTLQRVYRDQTGQEPTLLSSGGATYARSLKYGVAFGAVFPGETMTAHQTDEYATVDSLIKAMALYAQAIYELAK
ncbi:succinyl-diaminopimelate desuccinylase [Tumebacillus sp. BK434]|uniref:dipeptidase PepV n=1 Tax=Tumebacillus sp. BK434 TaxID=2512169 RepID=UPI001050FBDA|nr:dipeptidase PepV [Tumebacillus sp. BK434]TCP48664.1 succinyl-diaminopimelate desuccinylase [Tumebacillus sp. BK434]